MPGTRYLIPDTLFAMLDVAAAVAYAERELGKRADPAAAVDMARYMKTAMPFFKTTR